MNWGRIVGAVGLTAILLGCSGGGPSMRSILNASNAVKVDASIDGPFVLVELGPQNAKRLSAGHDDLQSWLPDAAQQPVIIGVSDVLSIAVVSNNEDGFIDFSQSAVTPLSIVQLPQQEVDVDGRVSVPTLGRVRAVGQTVARFEENITAQLSEVLVNPTAVVRLVERNSAKASVIGSIANPGSFPINQSNHHLLDLIGLAGGPTLEAQDLVVSLSRAGQTHRARLADVYSDDKLNVHIRRNDVISVEPNLTRVQVIGGVGNNAQLTFKTVDVDLMDVIGASGGLLNRRAALPGVFVYRNAPATQLLAMGAQLDQFDVTAPIPTVFQIDMSKPTALFAGAALQMMDGDIVYVADSLNEQINAVRTAGTTIVPAPVEYIRDSEFGTN